jgi:toxin ParE1/3/4
MVKVIWSEQAIDDLTNIANYNSRFSENYSAALVTKLFKKSNILKTIPKIGRVVPEKKDASIRELIEGNYRLIYQISNEERVDILTVHHSSAPLINL